MKHYTFVNHNKHVVQLVGPDKKIIKIGGGERITLSEFYIKYCPKYLRVADLTNKSGKLSVKPPIKSGTRNKGCHPAKLSTTKRSKVKPRSSRSVRTKKHTISTHREPSTHRRPIPTQRPRQTTGRKTGGRRTVGRSAGNAAVATTKFVNLIKDESYTISNDIGIGILSYNRLSSIRRLLESIERHTDLLRTTVFVSDESDQPEVKQYLRQIPWIVLIDNTARLGVAGNSNRLLRCLDRFQYKLILNDDVEIISHEWQSFYPKAMRDTGFHHFCYRQVGICGANDTQEKTSTHGGRRVMTVHEKPQGAVMAFDDTTFKTVGYYDTQFGIYGYEHVDWSWRVGQSGIQPPGYHDIDGAQQFFKIHRGTSAITNSGERSGLLVTARKYLAEVQRNAQRKYIAADDNSVVPAVSYIVPYRTGQDRHEAVHLVLANIKAQKFPRIEITLVEQDNAPITRDKIVPPIHYKFVPNSDSALFCKAAAFNAGVLMATYDTIILHDADVLIPRNYTTHIMQVLENYESCHVGRHVFYLDRASTDLIIKTRMAGTDMKCKQIVGYYEGGSLACTKSTFLRIGGFNEQFKGYGVEDCEFFERLKQTKMYDQRSIDLIHLDHGRADGWNNHHNQNKALQDKLKNRNMGLRIADLRAAFANKYGV